jgi:hypothetical protein
MVENGFPLKVSKLLMEERTVVRNAGRIHLEGAAESELTDALADPTYIRKEEPPGQADLLEVFKTWVKNTPGTFDTVVSQWVAGRLELDLPVNPGPYDPNERRRKSPTKAFKASLESVFNDVRTSESKRPKRKK